MNEENKPSEEGREKKNRLFFASKEKKKENASPNDGKRKRGQLPFVIFSIILIFISIFFTISSFACKKEEKVEYTSFLEQVEKGEVEKIKVNKEDGNIKYELNKKQYCTNYPYTDTFIETMLVKGVDVEYEKNEFLKRTRPILRKLPLAHIAVAHM